MFLFFFQLTEAVGKVVVQKPQFDYYNYQSKDPDLDEECKYIRNIKSWDADAERHLNTLRPRQNGRHFADGIFKCIFVNENVWIPIKISLTFVPQVPINNIPALVQIMAWHRPGDKPLSGPMMVRLPAHICVTRPQWVKYVLVNSSCLCPIHWSRALRREWRCSWSSANRRCSSYNRVFSNFIANSGATYIEDWQYIKQANDLLGVNILEVKPPI